MEISREERQQMRQRGAGTRKAKEVNFGFSFGSPLSALPAPAPLAIVPEAQNPSETQTAPNTTPKPLKISQPGAQAQGTQRTPGSARNKLPQRPSTYDIPSSDERTEHTRSNKRRKISSHDRSEDTPSRQTGRQPQNGDLPPTHSRAGSTESQTNHVPEALNTHTPVSSEVPPDPSPQPHTSATIQPSENQRPVQEDSNGAAASAAQGASPVPDPTAIEETQAPIEPTKPQITAQQIENTEHLHERHNTESPPQSDEQIPINEQNHIAATDPAFPTVQTDQSPTEGFLQRDSSTEALQAHRALTTWEDRTAPQSKDGGLEQDIQASQEPSSKTKKPRGRPGHESTTNNYTETSLENAGNENSNGTQDEQATAKVEASSKTKLPRGRPSSKRTTQAIGTDEPEPEPEPEPNLNEASSEPRRGRKPTPKTDDDQSESVVEPEKSQRGRPGKKAKQPVEPESAIADQPAPQVEPTATRPQRGRPTKKDKRVIESAEPEPEPEPVPADQSGPEVEPTATKSQRGRPAKKDSRVIEAAEPSPDLEPVPADQPEPEVEPMATKSRRGRPGKKDKRTIEPEPRPEPEPVAADQFEPVVEPTVAKPQRGRPANKNKRAAEVEIDPESEPAGTKQPESQAESGAPSSRGRPGKKARRPAEAEPEPGVVEQPASETEHVVSKPRDKPGKKARRVVEPEAELETESSAENQPVSEPDPAVSNSRRGRPGKKANRAVEPEPVPETDNQAETGPTEDRPRRKTREPRGETVPVTVYRLANVDSLGGMADAADEPGEEQESADELTTHQRTKMPSRGGVNPADVLSQICRETLEKTLTTLKDGIANEANATRRAEWTRKRKAVETFGSELEGRLMDLSGMLDSNFVLGVQLKKTKREMMDLRNHLYRVRRERENIALQMDAVRSKHMEEEQAKSSRNTISNSLHSLELALERNQQRSAGSDSSDLEFMLRSLADVSSRAPGAQGGLLHQIRTFNAQLEATAARLER